MAAEGQHHPAAAWQRVENLLVAVGIVMAMLVWGQPWWLLPAAFLVFDLSALGYLAGRQMGALCYNLVHNYTAPAALVAGWAGLQLAGVDTVWPLLLAACWGFHVAVDRALGYGLKLGPFTHTHLGTIGRAARDSAERA